MHPHTVSTGLKVHGTVHLTPAQVERKEFGKMLAYLLSLDLLCACKHASYHPAQPVREDLSAPILCIL